MTGADFWQHWYFHLPNFALAALVYTLLGRFALGFFLPPDSQNYIWRWFCRLTDWLLPIVAFITPRYVMFLFLPLIAAFWLTLLRFLLLLTLALNGMLPTIAGAP
ncbi:MAG: YggT family protein [Rhodospirillaceae bacterium]|nr:YggT family protein [Rhodospirillaceae bacterium]